MFSKFVDQRLTHRTVAMCDNFSLVVWADNSFGDFDLAVSEYLVACTKGVCKDVFTVALAHGSIAAACEHILFFPFTAHGERGRMLLVVCTIRHTHK